jgi:hypothetical protein
VPVPDPAAVLGAFGISGQVRGIAPVAWVDGIPVRLHRWVEGTPLPLQLMLCQRGLMLGQR